MPWSCVATAPTPGVGNEDYVICGPDWVIVLDGATRPEGVSTGCIHDVAWLVRRLGSSLSAALALGDDQPLVDIVAQSIKAVMDAHAATCDLTNPDSPSSTLMVMRRRDMVLDYLLLADSTLVIEHVDGTFRPITDDRGADLPGPKPYTVEFVSSRRNQPDGFWVASNDPAAAYEAISGSVNVSSVRSVGLFTDGVTRLNEWFGYSWRQIFDILHRAEPSHLIELVRQAESKVNLRFAKRHDDATVVFMRDLSD